jgi:hypothetical protein
MALAETTLSSACAQADRNIVVASATSFAADRLVRVGGEVMRVAKNYTSGTTIPVLRGQAGTVVPAFSHPASARVVHGDAADFSDGGVASSAPFAPAAPARRIVQYTGTTAATCALPKPGEDLVVIMNGSAINTLTVPVPTKDLDGAVITFVNSAAAAHVITFTGGLSGAGSSYDVVTLNATGQVAFSVVAANEVWVALAAIPIAGTVTNLTGTVA